MVDTEGICMASGTADGMVGGSWLKLAIWHPDCWTLEVTASHPGGLLGHGVHEVDGKAAGRFTAYANTTDELEALVQAIRDSPLTDEVWEVAQHKATEVSMIGKANATRGLSVRYDHENSINDAIISRGFIPDEPVRITDGLEYWTVVIHEDREVVTERVEEIRQSRDATVTVDVMRSLDKGVKNGMFRDDRLSKRQREVFELAQKHNYYSWPREISARELAVELDISEATLLEHLRKAEAKLLGTDEE